MENLQSITNQCNFNSSFFPLPHDCMHVFHCTPHSLQRKKKLLHWLHFCKAKQILPRNVIAHSIIMPWKIVTRTQVALVQGAGNTSMGCHSRAFVCNLDSEQQCSLPNSEIMVCKNWGIAVIGPSTPRPSKSKLCYIYSQVFLGQGGELTMAVLYFSTGF